MKVKKRSYGEQGEIIEETTLQNVFNNEINDLEDAADMLSNLSELLIRKGIVSLDEVSNQVLQLERSDPDLPTLKEIVG